MKITNCRKIILRCGKLGLLRWMPDKAYLKIAYWAGVGRRLDLNNPRSYNEKLQWLKLYYKNDSHIHYVDKYLVRDYVESVVGAKYLIPIYGVFESVDEIRWSELPESFVLKCTHGSGSNIICPDKRSLDIESATQSLRRWMRYNWFWYGRTWAYKHIKPRIICEKYLQDNITDYKILCFHGVPRLIQVHRNRTHTDRRLDFYDTGWNKTNISRLKYASDDTVPRPACLDEMLKLAEVLSKDDIHVRIDLYEVNQKVYFGEKTYFSSSGFSPFKNNEHDLLLGSWIRLPASSNDREDVLLA